MDKTAFCIQVEKRTPIVIVTPYGTPIEEMIDIIASSLERARTHNVYLDCMYEQYTGVIIMTRVPHHVTYNRYITPIYIVEWGVREFTLREFKRWIYPAEHVTLFPSFLKDCESSRVIPHYIRKQEMADENVYRGKIESLEGNITAPCVIYNGNVDRYELERVHSITKKIGVPVYTIYSDKNAHNLGAFLANQTGILLVNNKKVFSSVPSTIPIHVLNLDSTDGLDIVAGPNHHNTVNLYIESKSDSRQYSLLVSAIHDCNKVYCELIASSVPLTMDKYNNLYIGRE